MTEQMKKVAERYERATGKKFFQKTNADRIRSMSDEELAKLFEEIGYDMMEHRAAYWLNWLQEPAEEYISKDIKTEKYISKDIGEE